MSKYRYRCREEKYDSGRSTLLVARADGLRNYWMWTSGWLEWRLDEEARDVFCWVTDGVWDEVSEEEALRMIERRSKEELGKNAANE